MQCEGHLSGQHESLSADLTTPETAAAPRIADVVDLPGEPDDAARVDGRLWDKAIIEQRPVRSASYAGKAPLRRR